MPRTSKQENRNTKDGQQFAMQVASDLVVLPKEERAKAIKLLNALNETINKETEALAK